MNRRPVKVCTCPLKPIGATRPAGQWDGSGVGFSLERKTKTYSTNLPPFKVSQFPQRSDHLHLNLNFLDKFQRRRRSHQQGIKQKFDPKPCSKMIANDKIKNSGKKLIVPSHIQAHDSLRQKAAKRATHGRNNSIESIDRTDRNREAMVTTMRTGMICLCHSAEKELLER